MNTKATKKNKRSSLGAPSAFRSLLEGSAYKAKAFTRSEEKRKLGKLLAGKSESCKTAGN